MEVPINIGFIGDGQLARMSAQAAILMGFKCQFFGNNPSGPCSGLGQFHAGEVDDIAALLKFAKFCDVVTLENEFLDSLILLQLRIQGGVQVLPNSNTFSLIENKFIEKETFKMAGIPLCKYKLISKFPEDLIEFTFPLMLKTSKGGYDGYGNKIVYNVEEAQVAYNNFGGDTGNPILCEELVPFDKEVAITIARSTSGEVKTYPVVETIQQGNICIRVIAPAEIENIVAAKIKNYAIKAIECIDGVGIFSFEFFVAQNGDVLLNESAPRPHNSAHYTMDACVTSQFENHIRSITGLQLGSTELICKKAIMINLLGANNTTLTDPNTVEGIDYYSDNKQVLFHLYGKEHSKPGRKMGHVNLFGDDELELIKLAESIERNIRI